MDGICFSLVLGLTRHFYFFFLFPLLISWPVPGVVWTPNQSATRGGRRTVSLRLPPQPTRLIGSARRGWACARSAPPTASQANLPSTRLICNRRRCLRRRLHLPRFSFSSTSTPESRCVTTAGDLLRLDSRCATTAGVAANSSAPSSSASSPDAAPPPSTSSVPSPSKSGHQKS